MKIELKKILTLTIIIGGIISYNFLNIQDTKSYLPEEFYPGEKFSWTIDNISSGNNMWYNGSDSSFPFVSNWYANNDDELYFNITDFLEINTKYYLMGDFAIGNLSLSTNNYDIGFNLALSGFPWIGGLVALEQDWKELAVEEPFNGNNADIELNYQTTILEREVNAIKIYYNDSFQTTNLIYEDTTGILISANTTSGLFSLEMHLISSSIPLPSITNSVPLSGFSCFFIAIISLGIYSKLRRS